MADDLGITRQLQKTEEVGAIVQEWLVKNTKPFVDNMEQISGLRIQIVPRQSIEKKEKMSRYGGRRVARTKELKTPSVAWSDEVQDNVGTIYLDASKLANYVLVWNDQTKDYRMDWNALETLAGGLLYHELGHLRMTPPTLKMIVPSVMGFFWLNNEWLRFTKEIGPEKVMEILLVTTWLGTLQRAKDPLASKMSLRLSELLAPWIEAAITMDAYTHPEKIKDPWIGFMLYVKRQVYGDALVGWTSWYNDPSVLRQITDPASQSYGQIPTKVVTFTDASALLIGMTQDFFQRYKMHNEWEKLSNAYTKGIPDALVEQAFENAVHPTTPAEKAEWFDKLKTTDSMVQEYHGGGFAEWRRSPYMFMGKFGGGAYPRDGIDTKVYNITDWVFTRWVRRWHMWYNILEDQRLETQQAAYFGGMGRYLAYTIRWIMDPENRYLLTVGRRYLRTKDIETDLELTRVSDRKAGLYIDGYYPWMEKLVLRYIALDASTLAGRVEIGKLVELAMILRSFFVPKVPDPPEADMTLPNSDNDLLGQTVKQDAAGSDPTAKDKAKAAEKEKEKQLKRTEREKNADPEFEKKQRAASLLSWARKDLMDLWTLGKLATPEEEAEKEAPPGSWGQGDGGGDQE